MNESASSPCFAKDLYYELRSSRHEMLIAGSETKETITLKRGDIVLCMSFGRHRYTRGAFLRFKDGDGVDRTLFHPVSRFNRGAGNWREMNPMLIVALADKIPIV